MQPDQNSVVLKLPAVLNLAASEGFLEMLRQHLQGNGVLRLDASAVETLTLPCIQILLAAIRDYDQISIERASSEFLNAFEELGLAWQSAGMQQGEDVPTTGTDPMQAAEDFPQFSSDSEEERDMAKRILTIDDSKTMRDMLMLTLSDAGFDVVQAVDGQDGIDVLGGERVDVVITDINMPRMDGYEVIRQLRRNSVHKTTPILVLTTESDVEKRNLARDVGATGWMVKPFDPERLIATIRKVAP